MKEFLNRFSLSLIIITYVALLAPLYDRLNPLLLLVGGCCAAFRVANFYGKSPLISPLIVKIIVISCSLAIILVVFQEGVFNIMLHLIVLGFSLKFLELKSIRDVQFFIKTGFVLVALFFVFSFSIVMALYGGLLTLLLLAILLSIDCEELMNASFVKLLLKSSLISLPLALLLFIIIPRLPSLWTMPLQKQAITGLSDTVSPGQIAQLSRSSELAFRAVFVNNPVNVEDRYWRVMTLDEFDGQTWSQSATKKAQEENARKGQGLSLKLSKQLKSYELIIEPHYNYWIPALDYSALSFARTSLSDYALRSLNPLAKRAHFNVNLFQQVERAPLTASQKKQLVAIPLDTNPKTQRWVDTQRNKGLEKYQILNLLLKDIATENFRYTLEPPLLGENQVDDFLFSTQAGFCVHYASSYLYVARYLGVPARMVTGYLGGEWQAEDQFMSIRQYDAHAWVEIFTGNRWQRVDPTAYVAPERVTLGLQQGLSNRYEFLANEYLSLQKWRSIRLLNELRIKLAQIDFLWARWVINYDNKTQLALLHAWLAKFQWLNIFYATAMMLLLVFLIMLLLVFKPWLNHRVAAHDKIYLQLQRYYAKRGLPRQRGQTIGAFCKLVSCQHQVTSKNCDLFARLYNSLKYDGDLSAAERKKRIKQLRIISKELQKS